MHSFLAKFAAVVRGVLSGFDRLFFRGTLRNLAHPHGLQGYLWFHRIPFKDFAMKEARYAMLTRSDPERAEQLLGLAQRDIDERWHFYEQMAGIERSAPERVREVHP